MQPAPSAIDPGDLRALRRWLADLPLAEPGTTACRLARCLRDLNPRGCGPRGLEAALAACRPIVAQTCSLLQDRLRRVPGAAPASRRSGLDQLLQLQTAWAGALGVLLEVQLARGRRRPALEALRVAQSALLQGLHTCYRHHLPPARGLWRSLHRSEQLAVQAGVLRTTPRGGPGRMMRRRPPADAGYRAALLLAAVDPYSLGPGELDLLAPCLLECAQDLQPRPGPAGARAGEALQWRPESDLPPRWIEPGSAGGGDATDATVWHCEPAAARPRLLRAQARHGLNLGGLRERLLQPPALRRGLRRPSRARAILVSGLAAAHRTLRAETDPAPSPPTFAAPPALSLEPDPDGCLLAQRPPEGGAAGRRSRRLPASGAAPAAPWRVADISTGGVGLEGGAQAGGPQPGEAVILRARNGRANWRAGIVRWRRQGPDGSLRLGIQWMGLEASACVAAGGSGRAEALEARAGESGRVVLLMPADGPEQDEVLMLRRHGDRPQRVRRLQTLEQRLRLRCELAECI